MASQRWRIDGKTRDIAVRELNNIISSPESSAKAKTDAVKSLAMLDKLNLDEDKLHTPSVVLHADLNKLSDEQLSVRIQELEKMLEEQRNREVSLIADNLNTRELVEAVEVKEIGSE